jgi:nucleoside-diphosphate-sugar epimerase
MILVTGATGFIGSVFMRKLLGSGKKVRVLVRDRKTVKGLKGADVVEGDVLDPESLKGAARGMETVVHLAGLVSYTKPREVMFKVNTLGTRSVLEACRDAKRFVFSSSVSVYGRREGVIDEQTETIPLNPYGESKLEAERLIIGSGLDYVILRFAPVYGVGNPYWLKNLRLLDDGFPVPDTKNKTHVLSVDNAVQALLLAVEGPSGTYNIADAGPVCFAEFAETLVRLLGKEPKRLPFWLVRLVALFKGMGPYLDVLTQERHYDITAARERLGYRPKEDFEKQLEKMVKWYLDLKGREKERIKNLRPTP